MRTRLAGVALAALAIAAGAVVLTGCASVGDPLPPALNMPRVVTDLAAVQRGSNLVITFTTPTTTTDDMVLERFESVDVRVSDQAVKAEVPEPGKPVTVVVPSAAWQGQEARINVRIAGPKGRFSAFSETVTIAVGATLATPKVTAEPHPEGVRLFWNPVPGEQYRVFRDGGPIGSAPSGEFIDKTATFGKEYSYAVQAFVDKRESEPTAALPITPRDQFPPTAPKGLQAIQGIRSNELAWERNTEPDLGTYRIYRATGTGEFAVLVDGVEAIAFSDRQVEPGTAYRYRITALDKSGNESEPSGELTVRTP